jgi:hypothetical protein
VLSVAHKLLDLAQTLFRTGIPLTGGLDFGRAAFATPL